MPRRFGVCFAVCAAAFIMGMGTAPPVDLAALQAEIQQQLPAGTDAERVVAFLDAHHLAHSWLVAPEQAIYATIRTGQPVRRGTASDRVQLQFWFGTDSKLIKMVVRDYDPRLF